MLVGHDDAVVGLLLALVARQHAWLEGPPGCGKTILAEALGRAAAARVAAVRFHRDVREAELLGDALLLRQARGGVERLRRVLEPGPLLRSEVAVLDDLPRAPGEALGPLCRILSERRWGGRPLPLETAVATGVPEGADAYADPLEPTLLDRFAIQLRLGGLLLDRDWKRAGAVLDRPASEPTLAAITASERRGLQARAAALPIGAEARRALQALVERLAATAGGFVTDRAFGAAAPAVMRAHALLRGGDRVEPHDVRAVRYMVARRLPLELASALDRVVDEVLAGVPPRSPAAAARSRGVDAHAGARAGEADAAPWRGEAGAPDARVELPLRGTRESPPRARPFAAVEPLLRAFEGRLERGRARPDDDPGGQPRRYRRLRELGELFDADVVDAALFGEGRLPGWPRTYRRERRNAGGLVAVLRDVSASMEGRLSRWAGEVVGGIVRAGARRRMRVGYVEFNHVAERYAAGEGFFHRRYRRLLALARTRRAEGRTSYEAPLRLALDEFRGRRARDRHVVLLTDGIPIVGDPAVKRERALARALGVRVHTVFLGVGECPRVLDEISRETGGLRFVARPEAGDRLAVRPRGAAA